jgi:hypothetical protein
MLREDNKKEFFDKKCFLVVIFSEDSVNITRMNEHYASTGLRLVSDPVGAHLIYYRPSDGKKVDLNFPAVATFLGRDSAVCKNLDID